MPESNFLDTELPDYPQVWQQTLDWQPTPQQQQQFGCLYRSILRGNQVLNLTRITDPQEFWEKHLWDSLSGIADYLSPAESKSSSGWSVIDIGTGVGFPGLAVAIARPDWQVTLLDATRKKITFLESLLADLGQNNLGLNNVALVCDRAEQLKRQPLSAREFDLALARAVGGATLCAEYALPLLKANGTAILYRGQWSENDTLALELALQRLPGKLTLVRPWRTPFTQGDRHCLYLSKRTALNRTDAVDTLNLPKKGK
jgi:16S rRNA (guanine527-N7)-methyltransferase